MRNTAVIVVLSICSAGFAGDAAPAVTAPHAAAPDATEARKAFEAAYELGAAAVAEKKWPVARQRLVQALKALGELDHPNKTAAQVLLDKANRIVLKDDMLYTAQELLRLKQWVESEEAFRKVAEITGETDTLRKGVMAARAGLEADNESLKNANELLRQRKYTEAAAAYRAAAEVMGNVRAVQEGFNAAQAGVEAEQLLRRAPELLQQKHFADALKAYSRIGQILGETDEVKKGIVAAQSGIEEERKLQPAK